MHTVNLPVLALNATNEELIPVADEDIEVLVVNVKVSFEILNVSAKSGSSVYIFDEVKS